MRITAEIERQGAWLFRWRSFLPLAVLALFAIDFSQLEAPFATTAFHEGWEFICLMISVLGLLTRCLVAGFVPGGTSGRNTKDQCAESLNTRGIYSLVRHPLYLGNYLIGLGVTLISINWWMPTIYTLGFWLYYERIMAAEEKFLAGKFGDAFTKWANSTPAFFPRSFRWQAPELEFSLRTMLRREYTGPALVVLLHAGYEQIEHAVTEQVFIFEINWFLLLMTSLVAYFTLRWLKKHTSLLLVEGR